jgi:hypothetical protein
MDISKYIGLYLVKNGYCSLPGLGTLSLEKIGAKRFDATTIDPPKYNITFNAVGSIDDKFPHFIAINENISTNNATNAISVFGREVKEEIANNRPFVLEGLGRYTNVNGKMFFQQNSDLDLSEFTVVVPENVQPIVDNTRVNQADKDVTQTIDFKTVLNNPIKESTFSIGKVLLPIGLLAVLAVGGYFGYNYLKNSQNKQIAQVPVVDTNVVVSTPITDSAIVDSAKVIPTDSLNTAVTKVDSVNKAATAPVASGPAMKVAILTYRTEMEANAKSKKLTSYGNNTNVLKVDSVNYQVVLNLATTNRAPEMIIDSLRKFFNPNEKMGKVVVVK